MRLVSFSTFELHLNISTLKPQSPLIKLISLYNSLIQVSVTSSWCPTNFVFPSIRFVSLSKSPDKHFPSTRDFQGLLLLLFTVLLRFRHFHFITSLSSLLLHIPLYSEPLKCAHIHHPEELCHVSHFHRSIASNSPNTPASQLAKCRPGCCFATEQNRKIPHNKRTHDCYASGSPSVLTQAPSNTSGAFSVATVVTLPFAMAYSPNLAV